MELNAAAAKLGGYLVELFRFLKLDALADIFAGFFVMPISE